VVLMDMQMPEMDGLQATRAIRAQLPGDRQPRIVAMTANAMQGDREACLAAGMDDYVAKPIRVDELVAALERCAKDDPAGQADAAGAGDDGLPVLDREVFDALREAAGDDFMPEMIAEFLEDSPKQLDGMREAAERADHEE